MNREKLKHLAAECGFSVAYVFPGDWVLIEPMGKGCAVELERFYDMAFADGAAAEREACARVCEEKKEYSMPIPCPDGISGCLVAHYIPARREKTGSECAADIRARGEKC